MTESELICLKELLNKYFKHEFEFYRKAHSLVYGGNSIEDVQPRSLFEDVVYDGNAYQEFIKSLEKEISNHIKYVFILEKQKNRFED